MTAEQKRDVVAAIGAAPGRSGVASRRRRDLRGVAYLGDGVNGAAALRAAPCGIAMAPTGARALNTNHNVLALTSQIIISP